MATATLSRMPIDKRQQINVRVAPELADSIDELRMKMKEPGHSMPSRSEVIRIALEDFVLRKLGRDFSGE